jgi:hypothetical protein
MRKFGKGNRGRFAALGVTMRLGLIEAVDRQCGSYIPQGLKPDGF